jgi:hypothetical protein
MHTIPNKTLLTHSALVQKGKGILHKVEVKSCTVGTTIDLYDNEAPSGIKLSRSLLLTPGRIIDFGPIIFSEGLYVKIDGTAEIIIWTK